MTSPDDGAGTVVFGVDEPMQISVDTVPLRVLEGSDVSSLPDGGSVWQWDEATSSRGTLERGASC